MHADIIRLRDHGWLLPKFRIALVGATRANLVLADAQDTTLNRSTRLARLLDISTGKELGIPHLYDATLVGITRGVMTLSGIERLNDNTMTRDFDFAQTWLVTPVADPDRVWA